MPHVVRAATAVLLACLAPGASTIAQEYAPESAVPSAMSSFDAADLQMHQVTGTLDLARVVPNLTGYRSTGAGNSNAYFMRGLGNSETIATFDPAVGTYIDGLFVSRQSSNSYPLFDVDRVDVLRGPQGTQFGRNTTGGAILIGTRKPSPDAGSVVEVGVGSFDRRELRGSIDYPIND